MKLSLLLTSALAAVGILVLIAVLVTVAPQVMERVGDLAQAIQRH